MEHKNHDVENYLNTDPIIMEFRQRIGYEELVEREVQDGLILIDFRKIKPPVFMEKWPRILGETPDSLVYRAPPESESYYFDWSAEGPDGSLSILARVHSSYKLAQISFLSKAEATSRFPLPWKKCSHAIGTVCAISPYGKDTLFFFYKNVSIEITRASNSQIAEKTAEWLFEVLKAFSRDRMDAPFVLRRGVNDY